MATVATLMPKMTFGKGLNNQASMKKNKPSQKGNVYSFKDKEVDMMPGQWAVPGNPTPYELRVTIHTCKRLWYLNKEALNSVDCDYEATLYNIKVLEKLYIHLMDYLREDY